MSDRANRGSIWAALDAICARGATAASSQKIVAGRLKRRLSRGKALSSFRRRLLLPFVLASSS